MSFRKIFVFVNIIAGCARKVAEFGLVGVGCAFAFIGCIIYERELNIINIRVHINVACFIIVFERAGEHKICHFDKVAPHTPSHRAVFLPVAQTRCKIFTLLFKFFSALTVVYYRKLAQLTVTVGIIDVIAFDVHTVVVGIVAVIIRL